MTPRNLHRDFERAALHHVVQLRIDSTLRRYLLITAAREGMSISAAARGLLYEALDREPPVRLEEGEGALPFRAIVESTTEDAIDELAELLREGRS